MSDMKIEIREEDRQLILLGLAVLSLRSPGMLYAAYTCSKVLGGVDMFNSFRESRADIESRPKLTINGAEFEQVNDSDDAKMCEDAHKEFQVTCTAKASPAFARWIEEADRMRAKHIEQIIERIWADMEGRAGMKHELDQIAAPIVLEIKHAWREIILDVTEPKSE